MGDEYCITTVCREVTMWPESDKSCPAGQAACGLVEFVQQPYAVQSPQSPQT